MTRRKPPVWVNQVDDATLPEDDLRLFTRITLARWLGVHKDTVHYWLREGYIAEPPRRNGKRVWNQREATKIKNMYVSGRLLRNHSRRQRTNFSVACSPEQLAEIKRRAAAAGLTISAYIRSRIFTEETTNA